MNHYDTSIQIRRHLVISNLCESDSNSGLQFDRHIMGFMVHLRLGYFNWLQEKEMMACLHLKII
jgi:hypothetical protein